MVQQKGALNFEAGNFNPSKHTNRNKETYILEGSGSDHEGIPGEIRYQTHTMVKHSDGNIAVTDEKIQVTGATSALLYISIATNFTDYKTLESDYATNAEKLLSAAVKKKFASAIKEHSAIYSEQFNRFSLTLGSLPGTEVTQQSVSISRRSRPCNGDTTVPVWTLSAYLFFSTEKPASLQGIWCNSMYPAWDNQYTININAEANYYLQRSLIYLKLTSLSFKC